MLPSFQTSGGRQTFFTYDRNATGDGVRTRVSPQAFYYYKAFGAYGEYIRSRGNVVKGAVHDDITHESWQIFRLIRRHRRGLFRERGVRPTKVFDPTKGTWGALELAARYHVLRIDPQAVSLGFAAAGSSREAEAWTIGANCISIPSSSGSSISSGRSSTAIRMALDMSKTPFSFATKSTFEH